MANERDEVTDDERRALLDLVHWEIENIRFALSERIRMLKRILAKLRKAVAKARQEAERAGDGHRHVWHAGHWEADRPGQRYVELGGLIAAKAGASPPLTGTPRARTRRSRT